MNDLSHLAHPIAQVPSVRLFLFSGRPDPQFPLDGAAVADLLGRLRRIQDQLPGGGIEAVAPPPPQLGYRGLLVRLPASDVDQLLVFGGVLRFRRQGRPHSWRDAAGIERQLLNEAVRCGHAGLLHAAGVRVTG